MLVPLVSVAVTVALCGPGVDHALATRSPVAVAPSSKAPADRDGAAVGVDRLRDEARGRAGRDADEPLGRDELRRGVMAPAAFAPVVAVGAVPAAPGGVGGGGDEGEVECEGGRAEQARGHPPPHRQHGRPA